MRRNAYNLTFRNWQLKVCFVGVTLDLVVAIPNSISFMRADYVPDDVKVVRIDGKLSGEDGYPLKQAACA